MLETFGLEERAWETRGFGKVEAVGMSWGQTPAGALVTPITIKEARTV
jgi:hypothetical protein